MAKIPATPRAMKNVKLTFGDDEYTAHVSSAIFPRPTSPVTWTGMDEDNHTDSIRAAETLDLAVVQDWDDPAALCNYLDDHEGEQIVAVVKYPGGATFTSTITCVAPSIGGAVNVFNESTVSLPSTKPVKTFAGAGA